jgi:hypothetical protein
MNKRDLEKIIREKYPELNTSNLKYLRKSHLEQWINSEEITLSSSTLVQIFLERNERAKINQKVNQENFGLRAKLQRFINADNSEIIKAGEWLFSALAKKGEEKKEHLLEKDLVHKDNYNETLEDLKDYGQELREALKNQTEIAKEKIQLLEGRNDELRKQLAKIETYVINNYGIRKWQEIKTYFIK